MTKEDMEIKLKILLDSLSSFSDANVALWEAIRGLKIKMTQLEINKAQSYVLSNCECVQFLLNLYRHLKEED